MLRTRRADVAVESWLFLTVLVSVHCRGCTVEYTNIGDRVATAHARTHAHTLDARWRARAAGCPKPSECDRLGEATPAANASAAAAAAAAATTTAAAADAGALR